MSGPTKQDFEDLTTALNRVATRLEDGGSIGSGGGQSGVEAGMGGSDPTGGSSAQRSAYKNVVKDVIEKAVGAAQLDKATALMNQITALPFYPHTV